MYLWLPSSEGTPGQQDSNSGSSLLLLVTLHPSSRWAQQWRSHTLLVTPWPRSTHVNPLRRISYWSTPDCKGQHGLPETSPGQDSWLPVWFMQIYFIMPNVFSNDSVFHVSAQPVAYTFLLRCAQSCLTLCNSMHCSPPDSLSMGFSRQEYWSGLPVPPPGDLLLCLLNWQVGSLPPAPPGKLPPLTQVLISSRNTFTDTPRITFSQISGCSFSESVNT